MSSAPSVAAVKSDSGSITGKGRDTSRGLGSQSLKLAAIHSTHALLIALHAVALVAAIKKWEIRPRFADIALTQTGITAGLQVAFALIVGVLVYLTRGIAVDANIRAPPTLGLLHLRLEAWSGLGSSLSANWRYSRADAKPSTASPGLRSIFLYLGLGALLQISSGSIFASTIDLGGSDTLSEFLDSDVFSGSRFGDFDALWPSEFNLTSTDTSLFPPVALNAAVNMFAGKTNDTRYPGLQARLIHDTVNLDNSIIGLWNQARVNATLVNVHCSQVSNATVNTFSLPIRSSNLSLAVPSPIQDGVTILFPDNPAEETSAWINVSIPAPPYMSVPELNINGYWINDELVAGSLTTVYFQPWSFEGVPNNPLGHGHNQVVMVIATFNYPSLLTDSNNSTGHIWTFQTTQSVTDGPLSHAYVQVIGCSVKNDNLTATIDAQSRLLDPLTDVTRLIGPEAPHDDHPWDEFAWQTDTSGLTPEERQFLFAFAPSTPAYNSTSTTKPISFPETVLAKFLDGNMFSPFNTNPSLLVNFQGALERLFASYLWNVNRLCSPVDDIQPYWETCGSYPQNTLLSSAELQFVFPARPVLTVVLWRAIVSLVCSVFMWFVLGSLLPERGGRVHVQRANGLFDNALLLSQGSRIPAEVLEGLSYGRTDRALLELTLSKRLRYVEGEDGLGGYLDVEDSKEEA
ncbi:hypothetical protein FB45DRAFT_1036929 [Roridomyces roridus]|uniref:Uncharacterized protein n=1 Tax=Roridomyces roridus TaxID=1738132 RepID=A0AAD7B7X8_9AGAR|nr:hypothetical protein FB45DRAFT_1036929 [Roridomyces roridus]